MKLPNETAGSMPRIGDTGSSLRIWWSWRHVKPIPRILLVCGAVLADTFSLHGEPGPFGIIEKTESPDGYYAVAMEVSKVDREGNASDGVSVSAFLLDRVKERVVAEFSPEFRMPYRKPGPLYRCCWSSDGSRVAILAQYHKGEGMRAFGIERGTIRDLGEPDATYTNRPPLGISDGRNVVTYGKVYWVDANHLWVSLSWDPDGSWLNGVCTYRPRDKRWTVSIESQGRD